MLLQKFIEIYNSWFALKYVNISEFEKSPYPYSSQTTFKKP